MDNSDSSGHGGQPSPVDIVTWLDHTPIDRQFFQHVVSEPALQAAIQQGLLKECDDGYCRGESFESGEMTDGASLRKVLLSLDEWLSANPTDPQFWRAQYAPMSRHVLTAGRHALTGAHGEAAVQVLTRVATYLNLASKFDESIEAGTLARDLAKKYFGRDSEQFAAACVALGNVVAEHENKSKGRKLLNDALKIRESLHGRRSLPVADSLLHLGALCRNQQKFEESYDHFELCLEIREALLPPDHLDVAEALDAFGLSHYYREMPEGIDFVERGLEIRGKVLPEDHPWLAESLNNLALFLEQSGVHADFESIYRRCLAISETWYGPLHVEICTHAENLAMLLRDQGRFVEAEELFRKVILMEEAMHGAECDLLPVHIHELVMCLIASDKVDEAVPWLQRGLSLARSWPDENDRKLWMLLQFADRCSDVGNEVYAVRVYKELLQLLEVHEDPQMKSSTLCHLAMSLAELEEKDEAVHQFELAIQLSEREFGRNSQNTLEVLVEYRTLLAQLALPQKELEVARQIVAITRRVYRSKPAEIAGALHRLSFTLGRNGLTDEAETSLVDALRIYDESLGGNHLHVASVLITLAQAKTGSDPETAVQLLNRALQIQVAHWGEDSRELYEVYFSLAAASLEAGKLESAAQFARRCLDIRFPTPLPEPVQEVAETAPETAAETNTEITAETETGTLWSLLSNVDAAIEANEPVQADSLLRSLLDQL